MRNCKLFACQIDMFYLFKYFMIKKQKPQKYVAPKYMIGIVNKNSKIMKQNQQKKTNLKLHGIILQFRTILLRKFQQLY